LKVLQFNAVLLGPQVVEPLAGVLRGLLLSLTSCIHSNQTDENDDAMDGDDRSSQGTDRGATTMRYAIAALSFSEALLQLYPNLGISICAPAVSKVIVSLPAGSKAVAVPLLEAAFSCLGRMLWTSPTCLDEWFASDQDADRKIGMVLDQYVAVVTSVSLLVMLSVKAQKITFINQKSAAVSDVACNLPVILRLRCFVLSLINLPGHRLKS